MRRLRTTLLVAAALLFGVTLLIVGGAAFILATPWGHNFARSQVEGAIRSAVADRGEVYIEGLILKPLGSISLDTVEVRDAEGNVVIAVGPIEARYRIGPLLDREINIALLSVRSPYLNLESDSAGQWNIARLFTDTAKVQEEEDDGTGSSWRIKIDSLNLSGGSVAMTTPDSLPSLPPVRTTYEEIGVVLGPTHYALGRGTGEVVAHELTVRMSSPPVHLVHASGKAELFADSVWLDFPGIILPASRATLTGGIGFGGDKGLRLALTAEADTIGFSDIAWITPLIPTSGTGSAVVRVLSTDEPGVIRYAIESLSADATDSHLTGGFIADVGESVAIRDLDITMAPLDLKLLREIFGDSMPPPPWDGAVRGRLRAEGGPLESWRLNSSSLEFEDRRTGGTRSRLTVAGTVNLIAEPVRLSALTIGIDSLDVTTVGAVAAAADSLNGYLNGGVRLDGPVDNIRFSELALWHTDGILPRSVARGIGRFSTDRSRPWLEADIEFDTIGIAALGKAFNQTDLMGTLHGNTSINARGDTVAIEADFFGEGGRVFFDGSTLLDSSRTVLFGFASVERFDARRFLRESALPAHLFTVTAQFELDGAVGEFSGPLRVSIDSTSTLAGITFRDGRAELGLEPGGIRVDTLAVESPLGRLSARGRLSRDPALRDTLRFEGVIDSVSLLRGFLSDSLANAWEDSLDGTFRMYGMAIGSLDTVDVLAEWEGRDLRAGGSAIANAVGDVGLVQWPHATHGLVSFRIDTMSLGGFGVTRLSGAALVRDARWADASIEMASGDTIAASMRADVHWTPDSIRARLDSLDATAPGMKWQLQRPSTFVSNSSGITLDTVALRSNDGGSLDLTARFDSAGPIRLSARALRVPLAQGRFTGALPAGLNGLVSLEAEVEGSRQSPTMQMTAAVDSVTVNGRSAPSLAMRGDYEDRIFDLDLRGRSEDRDAFVVTAALPLDLALEAKTIDQRMVKEPIFVRAVADGTSLSGFEALIPSVQDLQGGFDADIMVSGEWNALEPRGVFLVREGAFALPSFGTGFRDLLMDVSFSPDSVVIHRARLSEARSFNDSASVEGALTRQDGRWRADFQSVARTLRVIDDPRVAEADMTWQLELNGPLDSLVLGGEVNIPMANAFIGANQRRVLDVSQSRSSTASTSNMVPTIGSLRVRLGNEVRLRSREANVQLMGEIAVSGPLNDPSLSGEVIANRGTYRLDLGLLQRTFQVDSGVVRFAGAIKAPHALDIHTSYLVRQANQEDVLIGAHITGTTQNPRILLSSSALGTTATETEIISYLLFGAPSFALDGERSSALRTASAALVPSLGGAVERALGGRIPFISELRVSTVASDAPIGTTLNSFEGLLNSFALTAGSQLGTDSFLSVSTGVCRGESSAAQSLGVWFGIAAEYRPRERLSAQVSVDPGSSPCMRVGTFRQIYQFGFDLFRDWRW